MSAPFSAWRARTGNSDSFGRLLTAYDQPTTGDGLGIRPVFFLSRAMGAPFVLSGGKCDGWMDGSEVDADGVFF